MNYLVAKDDKQLDICLRMIYPEQKTFKIDPVINEKGKMEFHVVVELSEERFNYYKNLFKTLTV